MLVLKRIHVRYVLRLSVGAEGEEGAEETARRVHAVHHRGCPVYRSIAGCIEITTELELKSVG